MKLKRDWPVFLTVCLGFGALLMVLVVCGFVGFGLHSVEGKMALYVAATLLLVNVLIVSLRDCRLRRQAGVPKFSRSMRRFAQIVWALWGLGACLLLASLLMVILGLDLVNFWVRLLCILGVILIPLGWLGILTAYYRRRQACLLGVAS